MSEAYLGVTVRARETYLRHRQRVHEMLRFGVAGIGTLLEDIAIFNVLLHMGVNPILSKAVSVTIATVTSYFINRHWAFRQRAQRGTSRELPMFVVLAAIGLGITEACLAVSHYGLGYTSQLADNISANVVGLVLSTAWRYLAFRKWVFLPVESAEDAERDAIINAPV